MADREGMLGSEALAEWRSVRATRIDDLLAAHGAVSGIGPGRRYRTEQINRSLLVVLVGEFQGFARRLHYLASVTFARAIASEDRRLTPVSHELLTRNRELDRRNPTAATLKSDFGVLGLDLGAALVVRDARNDLRLRALDTAVQLRNAIAHADEAQRERLRQQGHQARKRDVLARRSKLDRLAEDMDVVVGEHLGRLFRRQRPW